MSGRCERCGYSADDEQWPRFKMTDGGVDVPGELPISEMMERGWIPLIDPRDEDAPARLLAALRHFFAGGDIEILPEPTL